LNSEFPSAPEPKPGGTFLGHPSGLGYIVFTEAWERFSFYGMQALLVLYMATYLLHPGTVETVVGFARLHRAIQAVFGELSVQALATQLFGLYVGLIYLTPVFGGLLGDRVLGRTRAVLIGAVSMAIGHFLMAFEAAFLFALSALIVGSGLLKGNLAAQVGSLYEKEDLRRDSAFSIYNVAINFGATLAPLLCGTLGELYGWHYGFGIAGIGMLIGIVIYLKGRKHLPPDRVRPGAEQHPHLQRSDGPIIAAIVVLILIAALFWATQAQVWNSYPLWIKGRVARDFFDLLVPVTWFQSIDSLAVLVLAPLVLLLWNRQSKKGTEPGEFTKIIMGCSIYAAAFTWLATGELLAGDGEVALVFPVLFHFILGAGFMYVGPIMMSLISRAAPAAVNAMMVSAYYLSIFIGGMVSGWMGRFYEVLSPAQFWFVHAAMVGAGALLVVVIRIPFTRLLRNQSMAEAQ